MNVDFLRAPQAAKKTEFFNIIRRIAAHQADAGKLR